MAQDVAACEAVVDQVSAMLATSRASWRSYLPVVRDSIRSLDSKGFMNQPEEVQRQLRFLDVFQKYAFVEQDSGAIEDVAGWCLQHWLAILQRYPDYTFVLSRIGQYWLSKAQPYLARLPDNSSSSGGGSSQNPGEEYQQQQAKGNTTDEDARLNTADYVEARAVLIPAVDYFARAVSAAYSQSALTGELLATAAEAYMSLGNVSYARFNERYFRQAIEYLRMTAHIPGYALPAHLQQYLDDYGNLV